MLRSLLMFSLALAVPVYAGDHKPGHTRTSDAPTKFTVRVENISQGEVLKLSNGGSAPFALAPGLWVVHTKDGKLFDPGKRDAGKGLEALAEDGNPEMLSGTLEGQSGVIAKGIYNTPAGASRPGPITPGGAYEFTFTATPGTRLSIAEMFGQSNDLFYATDPKGIQLFKSTSEPLSGDITDKFTLWDAGTEVNQEPGAGPDQAPRQSEPNTGAAEDGRVKPVKDGFTYPKTEDVLRITLTPAQ